ncbi:hypothetical protein [Glutamicibacter ardleyensis]|uniref:hypothetical protein n=1 Tax=Glutamicibacter ardleyensis TaxID=225894 RepID=UPI003FD4AA36
MSASRKCSVTQLELLAAEGETAFRVAKDRYGAISVKVNDVAGPYPVGAFLSEGDQRGRYDTVGSTVYMADSRCCAYAEVLSGFRLNRSSLAKVAESIGRDADEYLQSIKDEALANGVDLPWSISVDWQMERSVYEIKLPRSGWWVKIDHANTLRALETLVPSLNGMSERIKFLTSGSITNEDRDMTTLIAHTLREVTLDDGSELLGINYPSKTLQGRCWAYWDRRVDLELPPGHNDLIQLISENVGPDRNFIETAEFYDLPILNGNKY